MTRCECFGGLWALALASPRPSAPWTRSVQLEPSPHLFLVFWGQHSLDAIYQHEKLLIWTILYRSLTSLCTENVIFYPRTFWFFSVALLELHQVPSWGLCVSPVNSSVSLVWDCRLLLSLSKPVKSQADRLADRLLNCVRLLWNRVTFVTFTQKRCAI